MVEKNMQTEMLLELVFSASDESDEYLILKKSIPLYLRKLNCFQAGVLKNSSDGHEESLVIPFVASKSKDWAQVKAYFSDIRSIENGPCPKLFLKSSYYYAFSLNSYGILILGRKKPFDDTFTNELEPIVNYLGKFLIQAKEKKQREKAEKSLRESEQCLRTLSDTTTAGVFIYHDDKIIYANPAAERFSGYSVTELMALDIMELVHPDFKDLLRERGLTSPPGNDSTHFEIKIIRKDGEERWMDINIGLIKWMEEQAGIISAFDTTKHKQAEEDLIKAKEKAEESDRLKSAFLTNMSHEIRTPMNGILGFSRLLKEPDLTGEMQQEYIRIIEKSGARMLKIINDIIDISKIESGLMEVSISETNINQQIEYIYNFFKPEVEGKGICFSFKNYLPSKEAILKTDREKIYAILTNLVKNAIKYTNIGSIEFGYKKKEGDLEFFVKDTGIGIANKKHEVIFERFVRSDYSLNSKYEGAGLGLAISKAYVEMLGGKIWVESEEGQGSIFYFTIPYHFETKEKIVIKNALDNKKNNKIKKLKILIVEDDEASELFITIAVKKFSKEIIIARKGIEAVETCRNNPDIDLILIDIKIPEIDGYEVTRQIRQFNKDVIIIAQTAFGLSCDREKAIEAGCNDYISKPIDKNLLIELIKNHVDNK